MSTFYRHTLDCPACGVATEVDLAKGLHITRLPEVRAEILAGTFQVFERIGRMRPDLRARAVAGLRWQRGRGVAPK